MKSALYVRVSTEEQSREGQSIEAQIDRLRKYAEFNQWENVEVYADRGFSAKDMRRPEMKRLIKDIESGQISVVATLAVDRLSRNLLDLLNFVELCEKHGASYVCAALQFDTGTPIGRMVLHILASFAEFERSMISTRVKETMAHVAKTKRFQGKPPYGYEFDENKQLVIVPVEAKLVREIANLYVSGYGYRAVAKELNERGCTTKKGTQWFASTIKHILTNPIYIGKVIWGRQYIDQQGKWHIRDESEWIVQDNCHDPILSQETFAKIAERLKRYKPQGGQRALKFKLSGMLRCGKCGSGMVSVNQAPRKPETRIFVCSNYQKNGACTHHFVKMHEAEEAVVHLMTSISTGELQVPFQDYQGIQQSQDHEFQRKMKAIQGKFQRQISAYENGLIDEEDLRIAKERVESEKRALEESRSVIQEEELENTVVEEVSNLMFLWNHAPLPTIQAKLREIVDHFVLTEDHTLEMRLSKDILGS